MHDLPLVGGTHHEREPPPHRAHCPSIPVHVRVRRARYLVVHDVVHGGHVQPTCRDVRREQHAVLRALEPVEVLQALTLLELRVEGKRWDIEEREEREQAPDAVDRREGDECAPRVTQEKVVEVRIFLAGEAVDSAFFKSGDDAADGGEVDDCGGRVVEVQPEEVVECRSRLFVLLCPLWVGVPFQVLLEVFTERGEEDKRLELAGAHTFLGVLGFGLVLNFIFGLDSVVAAAALG